jgi:hypothetical protein
MLAHDANYDGTQPGFRVFEVRIVIVTTIDDEEHSLSQVLGIVSADPKAEDESEYGIEVSVVEVMKTKGPLEVMARALVRKGR